MLLKNYNCTQQELYTAAELGWNSCLQYLAEFQKFSPMYTAELVATRQAEIKDAYNLPDDYARTTPTEIYAKELLALSRDSLDIWQRLKRYISKAWAPEFQKARTEEAGIAYNEKGSNKDWEAIKGLLSSGSNFITNNFTALTAGLNMPDNFQKDFDDVKTAFLIKHQALLESEEASRIASEQKLRANNSVYSNLIAMFLDGQEIFKKEEAILKQFVFESVLNLISGTGTAGFKGTITDEQTGEPIIGALLQLKASDKVVITDDEGKYAIQELAAGDYTATVTMDGYLDFTFTQTVKVGTVSTLNITLKKK